MRRRVTATLVMAATMAVVPDVVASGTTLSQPPDAPADIVSYLTRPGDQVVTVPDGTYSGGSVEAPHPETEGRYKGWLVLQAETQHGVTVTGDLILEPATSRVLFVGFRFVNARLFVDGERIAFWYSDHVYPDRDWYQAGRPVPRQVRIRPPATTISLVGSDLHDGVATTIALHSVSDIDITGVNVYDIREPPGSDPEDRDHVDAIEVVGGATTELTVTHSYFRGARVNHQTDLGDLVDLTYQNVWYTGAFGAAFQFNATNGNRIVGGKRINVRSWGHRGALPRDRVDNVDGVTVPVGSRPDRVDVVDDGVDTQPPPDGAVDPATRWRQQHPYESWPEYFAWASSEPD